MQVTAQAHVCIYTVGCKGACSLGGGLGLCLGCWLTFARYTSGCGGGGYCSIDGRVLLGAFFGGVLFELVCKRCHGAKSERRWRCVRGQWMSWAEIAQKVLTTKAELWCSMRMAVLIDCVGVGFFNRSWALAACAGTFELEWESHAHGSLDRLCWPWALAGQAVGRWLGCA